MERTPFKKNVSLRAYLNKGKDLNIVENDVSLIEHILKQPFKDVITHYTVTRLVAHPDCVIEKGKIQSLLYKNYFHFQFGAIKTEEQQSAFVNKFDLCNNVLIAPNCGETPKVVDYSIGWLQFFLLENQHPIFDWAKKYHSEYNEGLKAIDKYGFNIWHTLISSVSNVPDSLNSFTQLYEKLHILFNDYPEGMQHKSNFNETPYEMLEKISAKPEYSSHENLKKVLNVLKYFELHSNIQENVNNTLHKKIKI